jgi:glycosyltransferase involved in cell wall biosynthesis
MRVLAFGTYERDYPRNAQVAACLRRAGVEVVERHISVWEGQEHKWAIGPAAALRLLGAEARLLVPPRVSFDVVRVGYPGHLDLAPAKLAARGRPVVFDPLVSLSDSFVADRGRFRPGSLPARALEAIDRGALRAADLVIADTEAHADFLAGLAGIPRERVAVCLVGAEERIFGPGQAPAEPFRALFVGKLIPLHGLETIVAAARLAPEVPFRIVGSGQLEAVLADPPANVERVPWVEYAQLPGELWAAGCALGIFGSSAKAARVIPNKAYQALACGTPLVTGDTPAARELLVDGESALLVPPGSPEALAAAVRRLAGDATLRARIAAGGLAAYRARASEEVLGRRWRGLLEELVARRAAGLRR